MSHEQQFFCTTVIFSQYTSRSSGSGDEPHDELIYSNKQTPPLTPSKQLPPKSPTRNKRRSRTTSTGDSHRESVVRAGSRTIYTAGRPPWYTCDGQLSEAFIIGKHLMQYYHFMLELVFLLI